MDAAAAFGRSHRYRIVEGMQADLLPVNGGPDENIMGMRNFAAAIKAGQVYYFRLARGDSLYD